MKKTIILSLLMAAFSLSGCYEDKGNYNYNFDKINSVEEVRFTAEPYEGGSDPIIYQNSASAVWQVDYVLPETPDTIEVRINVETKTSNPSKDENLEYVWYRSYSWDEKAVRDTIHTQSYVNVLLPGTNLVNYNITLQIRDKETDVSFYVPLSVRTRALFTNSLFVLHGNAADRMHLGNVEFLDNENIVTTDAYKKAHTDEASNPFAMTRLLGYRAEYASGVELITFNTNGSADVFNPFGLERKYPNTWAMPTVQGSPFIANFFLNYNPSSSSSDFRALLSTDGRFYTSRGALRFFEPGTDSDSPEHQTPDQYKATACIQAEDYYLLYDEKNARFLYMSKNNGNYPKAEEDRGKASMTSPLLDAKVNTRGLVPVDPEEPTDKYQLAGKQAIFAYISYFNSYMAGQDSRFIFYDPKTHTNFMYQLSPTDSKEDKAGGETNEGVYKISLYRELSDILLEPGSPIVYNPAYTLDFIFYAEGGTVYRYNVSNGDKEIIYEAPAGYEISILKFRQNENYMHWQNLYRYLSIGMNRNAEGAVAEIKLTTAGDVDTKWEPRLYEGFENIQDLQFCNELLYGLE